MIRVKATKRGFGGTPCHIIEPGTEFSIPSEQAFSPKWMERLDPPAKPEGKKAPEGKQA